MAAFHYVVKLKLIVNPKDGGEIEFLENEKKFEDENPIVARNLAFNHYQSYVDVLLQANGKKYYSDEQAREDLKSFVDPGTTTKIKVGGAEIELSDSLGNGIGVFMVIDVPKPDNVYDDKKGDEISIHSIGFQHDDPNLLMYGLQKEYEYYTFYNYKTADKAAEVVYCDSEEWGEGYLGDGQWLEGYFEPNTNKILETPFDWTGYSEPYWWGELEDEETEQVRPSIRDIIQRGESNTVEFKPALLYNFTTGKGGIGVKAHIAKAICAFLNSNGGVLFIGVTDDGEIQGLSHDFSLSEDKNEKDFFKLEFDQMLAHFLSFGVKSNVSGDFHRLDDKDIFVVFVMPSKRRPTFLKKQDVKEFYVRGEASSRQLTDVEELVNYCIDKWGTQ